MVAVAVATGVNGQEPPMEEALFQASRRRLWQGYPLCCSLDKDEADDGSDKEVDDYEDTWWHASSEAVEGGALASGADKGRSLDCKTDAVGKVAEEAAGEAGCCLEEEADHASDEAKVYIYIYRDRSRYP